MVVSMTGSHPNAEILTGPQRRRRWSVAEKLQMVAETREPRVTVSLIARRRGVSPNQLFTWRMTATQAEEEVVPASAFRAQQEQIRELQRLLGRKTMEVEILREALDFAKDSKKTDAAVAVAAEGRFPMKVVCETLGVARSNAAMRAAGRLAKRRGRPPLPQDELLANIKAVIAEMPSYGYARVWAVLRRKARAEGRAPVNRKPRYARSRSSSS